MPFIPAAIGAIASGAGAVASTIGSIASGIGASGVAAASAVGGVVSDIAGGTGNLLSSGANMGNSVLSDVGNALSDLFNGGLGEALKAVTGIANNLTGVINAASKTIQGVVAPIAQTVDAVTHTVQALNDQIIGPIANTLGTFQKEYTTLVTALHTDLQTGLQGILKIPADISAALTGVDAQFQRMTEQMGMQQRTTAEEVIAPAISKAGEVPLKPLAESFHAEVGQAQAKQALDSFIKAANTPAQGVAGEAYPQQGKLVPLPVYAPGTDIQVAVGWLDKIYSDSTSWWGFLLKYLHYVLYGGDYIAMRAQVASRPVGQQANRDNPTTILSPGEVIEAQRRGLIEAKDMENELLSHGIGPTRQYLMYRLTDYVFSPREAVDLRARGIIDDQGYAQLMSFNNLDTEQGTMLQELNEVILGIGDAVTAYMRNIIGYPDLVKWFDANKVNADTQDVLLQLATSPVSPRPYMIMDGRRSAAAQGLLVESLSTEVPKEYSDLYVEAQLPATDAQVDWLSHWQVPRADWWVNAYFRKARTREEVYAAFEANNIPSEIWDDIFVTEEELPPVWLVPDIVASGVWGESEAVPQLMKLGFSEDNAKVLYDYGKSKGKSTKAATAADLAKVSLGNAKALFDDGIIDAAGYKQILTDHGYSDEAASLTVELADYQQAATQRKQFAQVLVAQVKLGQLTQQDAESQLFNGGFTNTEVAKYIQEIEAAKVIHGKLPTEAQLDKMLTAGIIDIQTWSDTMQLLGYSQLWTERLVQLVKPNG